MAFQGNFPPRLLPHLDLPKTSYKVQGLEFHGQFSFLKAGLFYADHINAVSPTYAEEIQTSDYGYGLEGLLAQRNDQLSGILNGVDTSYWNPLHDPYLPENYSSTGLAGKAASKLALQKHFGLEQDPDVPLLGIVSRLTRQKGIDLVLVEGFKHVPFPRIELHRPSLGHSLLHPEDSNIIAVATDEPVETGDLPRLDLNNAAAIAEFILAWLEEQDDDA